MASFTKRSFESSILQSPGIIPPADKSTTSPGTTSSMGITAAVPSLSTETFILTMLRRFFTAFAAPYSCQKPSKPLTKTIASMMRASTGLLRKNESTAAKSRIMIIGLLNWERRIGSQAVSTGGFRMLWPLFASLLRASSVLRPPADVPSLSRSPLSGTLQNSSV